MRIALLVALAACGNHLSADDDSTDPSAPDAAVSSDGATAAGQPRIPSPTGPCPDLANDDLTFAPAGMAPRTVKLALDPAQTAPGPLILYWHATFSSSLEASYALGDTHAAIVRSGGVIASPSSDSTAGMFEWFIVNQSPKLDDFLLADEIVACLVKAGRVDPRRIHSIGMSAGALQTTALSFYRASYIASVVTYSGGLPAGFSPTNEDPNNKFAALIFEGGETDNVFGVDFQLASKTYRDTLVSAGHFATLCEHANGHEIPWDAAPSVAAWFDAHTFGTSPSPYASGLPGSFPSYCAR